MLYYVTVENAYIDRNQKVKTYFRVIEQWASDGPSAMCKVSFRIRRGVVTGFYS